ncbi:MAG: FtsX-like permease family protein [Phycisphaerae bacterium]|nr:FtsX-like permease family protein [Phycisphaerae bacterium]
MMFIRVLIQTVVLALAQIWANKVRAMLTTLGIIIAVAAVIIIVGAMTGLKTFVLDQFATFGANKVWVFPRMPPNMRDRYSFRQLRLTTAQIDGIAQFSPSLERITPVMMLNTTVQFGDRVRPGVPVQGVRPSWHEIEQRFALKGRPLAPLDEEERRQVCLVNDKAIDELGLDADPTGDFLLLDGRRFLIVGVVETKAVSPMFGGNEAQSELIIPFRTGEMMRPEPRMFAIATTRSPELFADAKVEIGTYLRRVRHLKPDEPDTFGVEAIEQVIEQFKKVAGAITVGAGAVVGISLLVGGIGIMNIMLVSVSERTREIGLRKAVGARPGVILIQFLVEAVVLCLVGAGVGLLLGNGAVLAMRMAKDSPLEAAQTPMWAIVVSAAFAAATGVIFGMFPAIKAARLNPIDALRHE